MRVYAISVTRQKKSTKVKCFRQAMKFGISWNIFGRVTEAKVISEVLFVRKSFHWF